MSRTVIINADDFGVDAALNEAVELAFCKGVLTSASLMVAEKARDHAVKIARAHPKLGVGLHVTVVDAAPILSPHLIPNLMGPDGSCRRDLARASFAYQFSAKARRQLKQEITAQFEEFRALNLPLDHVNAHIHFQLHPAVFDLICEISSEYGSPPLRIPFEPPAIINRARIGPRASIANRLVAFWARKSIRQARKAGIFTNDYLFGNAWSGDFDEKKLISLLPHLPSGVSEIHFHPTVRESLGGYPRKKEFEALTSLSVKKLLDELNIERATYRQLQSRST